jgi:hypothetical protein
MGMAARNRRQHGSQYRQRTAAEKPVHAVNGQ